jgi:hypothetical protein
MKTFILDEYGSIPLKEFEEFVDIDRCDSYTMTVNEDKSITLLFFDKDGKQVELKEKTK